MRNGGIVEHGNRLGDRPCEKHHRDYRMNGHASGGPWSLQRFDNGDRQ